MVTAATIPPKNYVVVGLQNSGKTTFAAALWHLVSSAEVEDLAMRMGDHSGDFAYVDQIAKRWALGYRVDRTESDAGASIGINLIDNTSGFQCCVRFDDMAGERFEAMYATRQCDTSLVEAIDAADGIILFISAWSPVEATIIETLQKIPGLAPTPADLAEAVSDIPWDPASTPRQVMLVDILQAFNQPPFTSAPRSVAVVVSAWDVVTSRADETSPADWIGTTYPLLAQYLASSNTGYRTRFYGVSAQGADAPKVLDGPEDPRRAPLLNYSKQSHRIAVLGTGASRHDLTAPLHWLASVGDYDEGI